MRWIYLSPHFDDAAFSCGGLISKQVRRDLITAIWTICAGDPPPYPLSSFAQSLHARWQAEGNPVNQRRREDLTACGKLGAAWRHFSIPDCIYRRSPRDGSPFYTTEEALFGAIHPEEASLIQDLSQQLAQAIPEDSQIVCPLTIGGHVDHRLTRAAAEKLGRELRYYADFPYVQMPGSDLAALTAGMQADCHQIARVDLQTWVQAAGAHASQIGSFWESREAMQQSIRDYYHQRGALLLWRKI